MRWPTAAWPGMQVPAVAPPQPPDWKPGMPWPTNMGATPPGWKPGDALANCSLAWDASPSGCTTSTT